MDIKTYWRILLRRGWIILLVAAVTTISALAFSKAQEPVYRATVLLSVQPARLDWGLQQTLKNMMRNYSRQIKSRQNAQQVIDQLQLDMSPDSLKAKLNVSPIESDLLIQVDVKDHDPIVAQDIARVTAEVFVAQMKAFNLDQDKRDRVYVTKLEDPEEGSLFSPKTKINVLAGALLGALLGAIIALILEYADDTIKSTEDVGRYVGEIAILGIIPTMSGSASAAKADRPGKSGRGFLGSVSSSTLLIAAVAFLGGATLAIAGMALLAL